MTWPPGVSPLPAEDYARILDTYADRVHDALRRGGVNPDAAAEIVLTSAADLADAAAAGDRGTAEAPGWWFAHAFALARRLEPTATTSPAEDVGGPLRDSADDEAVRQALEAAPARSGLAVMLRDVYDVPPSSVAVVLGLDLERAAQLTAEGRLALISSYDGRPAPTLSEHAGRVIVTEGDLGLLADGGLDVDEAAALRKHVSRCAGCEEVLAAQDRGRRLASGLPIVGLRDEDRDVVLPRLKERAAAILPTVSEMLLGLEEADQDRPLISPLLVVAVVAGALVAGIGVGAVLAHGASNSGTPLAAASTTPTPTHPPRKHHPTPTPTPTPSRTTSPTPSPTPSPTKSPKPSPTHSPTPSPTKVPLVLAINPTSGPSGTTITVTGSGWQPGSTVEVTFDARNDVGDSSTVFVNNRGTFTTQVVARDQLSLALDNGRRTIDATNTSQHKTAVFTLTPGAGPTP